MLSPTAASVLAGVVIATATSTTAGCPPPPPPRPTHSSTQRADPGPEGVVIPAHCTIVTHRGGNQDWFCEDVNPRHPNHYPSPRLQRGDKITGKADVG